MKYRAKEKTNMGFLDDCSLFDHLIRIIQCRGTFSEAKLEFRIPIKTGTADFRGILSVIPHHNICGSPAQFKVHHKQVFVQIKCVTSIGVFYHS